MDAQIERTLRTINTLGDLQQFETNARTRNALTVEIQNAIRERSITIVRTTLGDKIGIDLSAPSPAETKIIDTVCEFLAIRKQQGKNGERTLQQLRHRGLKGAAEASVSRSKPTQGFEALIDANRPELSYEQIIVDHENEFRPLAVWYAKRALGLPHGAKPTAEKSAAGAVKSRNPAWSKDELVLALDLYLRFRNSPPGKDSAEIASLSALLGLMRQSETADQSLTYRNTNGVYMKIMNFRRFDPEYLRDGKVGLTRGNKLEEDVWFEFVDDPDGLLAAVTAIKSRLDGPAPISTEKPQAQYWVFVCNPKRWHIDKFLSQSIDIDTWGVRPSDRERFAAGQLGLIRVGVDRRTASERNGSPPLQAGIYAVCQVEGAAFDGSGASDEYWAPGAEREPGWPTVKIRYLKNYYGRPLTIDRLKNELPSISGLLLNGFQAASFPISADDFTSVLSLLGTDAEAVVSASVEQSISADRLAAIEEKYLRASPEVKERVSHSVERGPVGAPVKQALKFRCQVCDALGLSPYSFTKENGEPYVEAHHVMPVSRMQVGSLAASNIMVVCANHHRQLHYGGILVSTTDAAFEFDIGGISLRIPRLSLGGGNQAEFT